ncbi:MAG TPA: hypothetical protein VHO90_19620, partial [Bacteroidales bacterium]|nr:hypothetical protein [Bacteroidales bacterium]
MLKKVRNDRVDKQRWDWAIANCDNPHVYMLSWYLDVVSPGWQALILGDYKFILPLPVKYRYSIPYLVQPLFCQRLAISGIGVTNALARKFYRRLFWQFPYYNLQIDNFIGLEKRRYLRGRINYTLDLTPSYDVIVRDYHENTVRNLKKATHANLKTEDWDSAGFTAFCALWARGISPSQLAVLS